MQVLGHHSSSYMRELHASFNWHRDQIEKISRRIYDGLYQLIKIKFGLSEHDSEHLQSKFAKAVGEKLQELQGVAARMNPNQRMDPQQHQDMQGHMPGQ